jgi:hypothetical protein
MKETYKKHQLFFGGILYKKTEGMTAKVNRGLESFLYYVIHPQNPLKVVVK